MKKILQIENMIHEMQLKDCREHNVLTTYTHKNFENQTFKEESNCNAIIIMNT